MDSDDSPPHGFDPSTISLNPSQENASRSLTQKLSIITDHSVDSTDYGSPLVSTSLGDPESASPSVDFDGTKKNQMSYSSYLSGRAQEVAKRRRLIERLEKARDNGILMSAIPQTSELTLTQLSMVLRRALKAPTGLREFVSDTVLQHIFEDAPSQTPLPLDNERIHVSDIPNEPNCLTDQETDVSDEEDLNSLRYELSISDSCQSEYYRIRRNLISADRFASKLIMKLIEKQDKLKSFVKYDEFRHQEPLKDGDTETCVRCRPLIEKPKRTLFSVKSGTQLFRSTSPPPDTVNIQNDTDLDQTMSAINVTDKISVEHVMSSYLYRLGTVLPHFSAKNHAAFPEIGKKNEFFGFPSEIRSEVSDFPQRLKPVHSNVSLAQKRRYDSTAIEDEDDIDKDVNYPLKIKSELVKQQFMQRNPSKLKSAFPVEERVAPLKIKRSSIQLPNTAVVQERHINPFPFNRTNTVPAIRESRIESAPTQAKSSSSTASSSDDSSSSDSESDNNLDTQVHAKPDENILIQGVEDAPMDSGNESSSSSTTSEDSDTEDENQNALVE